jgi:predicted AlkP superfamily pyrophosphatase or phosphodiesterase
MKTNAALAGILIALSLFFSFGASPSSFAGPTAGVHTTPISLKTFQQKPKLVVVMVVDQFRADYLTRFQRRFLPAKAKDGSPGGYNYLMSSGAYFPFAEYDALQCMTGPGHAMILSGSYPYQTGITLNGWFDEKTRKPMYCSEDSAQAIVGYSGEPGKKAPTGMSPLNFHGTTVGDELKNAGYPSKVVSVALKDRAAIFLGGHRADLAFWFDPVPYRWVSSKYYLPDGKLPSFLEKLNEEVASRKGSPYVFEAPKNSKTTGLAELNPDFRHTTTIGTKDSLKYPIGLDLTATAAERALDHFKLGQGKATDLLAVSFSSHDYLAHYYGPNAAELEEMTVAEDRVISGFLKRLQNKVPGGLKDVVLILTADHGGPPLSDWAVRNHLPAAAISAKEVSKRINDRLNGKFGKSDKGDWVIFSTDLNFFFSPEVLADRKASRTAVENEAKLEAQKTEGVFYVFSRTDYEQRHLPPGMFHRQILRSYVPGRSGDIVMIPMPFVMEGETDYLVNHMTSYSYDRTVPLIIAGPKVKTGIYSTHADVVDLAPTLSFMLGIIQPSTAEGRVLSEILTSQE